MNISNIGFLYRVMIHRASLVFSHPGGVAGDHRGQSVMYSFDSTARFTILASKELALHHRCKKIEFDLQKFANNVFRMKFF